MVLVVALVLAPVSILGIPRPGASRELPLPVVDARAARATDEVERARAAAARAQQLPWEVRAVGELVRRYGAAEAARDGVLVEAHLARLREHAREALAAAGAERLAELRALQVELFLAALDRWRVGEPPSGELRELGGSFAERAVANGWIHRPAHPPDREHLAAAFRARWNELVGLGAVDHLALSGADWQRLYRGSLLWPDVASGVPCRALRRATLRALGRHDPSYPVGLALGILELDGARPERALHLIDGWLRETPAGPWRLRALQLRTDAIHALRAARRRARPR